MSSPFRGRSLRRAALGALLVSACAAPVALANGGSGNCMPGNGNNNYCQLIPTQIIAQPIIPAGLFATLENANTGAGIPGQTVIFRAGSTVICVMQTDAHGNADCDSLGAVLLATLNLGYTVTYAGNSTYAPSSGFGPLLSLLGITLDKSLHNGRLNHSQRARLEREIHKLGRAGVLRELRAARAREAHHRAA